MKPAMSTLVLSDPAEVGFDARRLNRIDTHFKRYVDDGRLPGWQVLVSRHGKVVHLSEYGRRDREAALPVERDTIFRIYSMTKPITSVAAMMLYEEGAFELTTPVSKFIPAFGESRVYIRGNASKPLTVPQTEPMRIWHLMTHTAGLTYGFHHAHAVDEAYRGAGFEWGVPAGMDLAAACEAWARLPLAFQPGSEWLYSHATDVLGRVVEVVSGQPLDVFLKERIFDPLGMTDTAFSVAGEDLDRLAALYAIAPGVPDPIRYDAMGKHATTPPTFLGGGGGLVSTTADYHRFTGMLRNGGELDGQRLLGPRTLAYMRQNHLPGGADLERFGRPLFAESNFNGVGFGLGFSVALNPLGGKTVGNAGEYGWGGAASTAFWVDPVDDVVVIFMTQLLPSSTHPIRSELRGLVYQALID